MMRASWKKTEEELLEYYEGDKEELSDSVTEFLEKLSFVNGSGEISSLGRSYLDSKFIFERDDHKAILQSEVLNIKEIRELCQSFYGQKTSRNHVERYFKSKTEVTTETEVGRILGLLNQIDIVSYSKRTGVVQFKETEQVEEQDQESYRVTHRTPYSNLVRFRKCIRACAGDILWIDAHFRKKGLEPLAEEVTGEKFDRVRILSGPSNIEHHVRDDFERFKDEMENRGIEAEFRVITSAEILRGLHDRWILSSEGSSWNVPPITSIYGNQEAEIHKTGENIDFEDWWNDSKDIIEDWNDIQGNI